MSFDTAKGNWNQIAGKLKEKWGELTDDDFVSIKGSAQNLAGKLQERYGMLKEQAEQEANDFFKSIRKNSNNNVDLSHEHSSKASEAEKENITDILEKVSQYVKAKPLVSVVLAFAMGIALALIIGH